MTDSVFPVLSLDRKVVRWEEHLQTLTPWEHRQGVWFKREDFFAPLGYGGPNGSKMRQLVWMFYRYRGNHRLVVTGASVQSPQLSMTAILASHHDMAVKEVVYSRPHTVLRHVNPRIAAGFGATFIYASGPYNPIIQAKVADLALHLDDGYGDCPMVVPYGISVPIEGPTQDLLDFHSVGAHQVANLPLEMQRLIIPAGSCNSLLSILLGLSRDSKNLEEIYTIGIGPDKRAWLTARAERMGLDLHALCSRLRWKHMSLHAAGYGKYGDKFTGESWDGIEFHPVYEGRLWKWLRTHNPVAQDGRTGVWLVGAEAKMSVVEPFFTQEVGQ
jgi:1-aminocyclopropane-1-carboxylate deaminase/D-cysteine desulfhydrase-like pyridoxal-dependent ACC family enzyme